ncbi:hypothetical protein N7510_000104 [Penicillium lagena]|uniref:uncharacterized protein n=1 Tax=Penicillium lagena TaxID=94218 RepID=UPI00254224E4|nr:uncharacterized protein N7510_000104 [Penicillium lagena]KAJ5623795.1 hypothetical protein N7510_000104 [Penicillium lagena]
MVEQAVATYVPQQVPLPPVPATSYFSETQWEILFSLADAIIPSICTPFTSRSSNDRVISQAEWDVAVSKLKATIAGPDAANIAFQYLKEDASSNPAFRTCIERIFGNFVHEEGRSGFGLILNALNTYAGSFILTGSTTLIHQQPLAVRENILRGWDTSRLPPLRVIYRVLTAIVKKSWVITSPTISLVLGIPRVPVHGKPSDGFPYEFLQFPPGDLPETIEIDVVVVGSGCGGAVAAKNLAEAGNKVLLVEKSYSYTTKTFPMTPNEGFVSMFEAGGAVISDDGCTAMLAGSTWGGGGTVNWSASLQTQGYVREEWANTGLPFFTSLEFQRSLDRVCDRMGVNTEHIRHNRQNNVILEGARKLGYAAKPVPQNTGNSEHYCGYCMLGCPSTGKNGPTVTWLADAAQAGATFVEGFRADKVLFNKVDGRRVASGVEGTWTSRDSFLGLSGEGAVRLIMAVAVFDEETRPWEGSALTTVVNEFEDLDGRGHGVKIEGLTMMPSLGIPVFPWRNGLDYKLFAASINHSTSFITLTRDRDGGRVYPDPADGRVRVDYAVSAFDRKHVVEGLIASAKIAYISGAKEFHTTYRDMPPFIRPNASNQEAPEGTNDATLQGWIAELRRKSPLNPERAFFGSAHQMGTCRMGRSPKSSVVDMDCQVWGAEGLYVVDASVFPSASGVNPMVTNMAIADWASRNISRV